MSFFSMHQLIELLHAYGNVALATVVALECLGLPLPGETLLIAAAVIAGTSQHLNIALVILSRARRARSSASRRLTGSAGALASVCSAATDAISG